MPVMPCMTIVDMSEQTHLTPVKMKVIELNEGWSFKQKDTDDEWLPTSVPTKYVELLCCGIRPKIKLTEFIAFIWI